MSRPVHRAAELGRCGGDVTTWESFGQLDDLLTRRLSGSCARSLSYRPVVQYDVLHQEFGGELMTFGGFDVETAVLRRQGQNFTDLGADFAKASKQLETVLEGLGEPWSDADFGDVFGEIYTPIRDGILASMDSLERRA